MNQSMTFRQIVTNIREIRREYEDTLRLFYDIKKEIEYKRKTRNKFYSLNIEEWQKDMLWSYMNDYVELITLQEISLRYK